MQHRTPDPGVRMYTERAAHAYRPSEVVEIANLAGIVDIDTCGPIVETKLVFLPAVVSVAFLKALTYDLLSDTIHVL